ncbi:transposase [Cucumis melo var. makuwa]|uniref:Transposase n=1 Tax=Cucumis melo var. makuwa TaxID=1194695 RepID=A0A5A7U451_CUCMM|nr:transposase [Cucumis melo var. makuwa]
MESLRKLNSGKARSKKWIQEEHNCSFSRWLSTRVAFALEVPKNSITPSLRWIAHGPSSDVATYSCYMINGYYYHTKRRDDIRRVQNSGVSITATTMQCDWVDNRSGVKVDELGFTIVELKCIGHKSDSFILATQAKQVFYVQDSVNPEWLVVLTSPQRTIEEDFFEDEIRDMLQECGYETIQRMPNVDTPNEADDTTSTYIRHDCEGRWVEKVRNITAIFMIHRWSIAVRMKEKCFQNFSLKIYSPVNQEDWESFVDARLSEEWEKIMHDVSYHSTLWKETRKGRNNDYFDDATQDCASRIDELVATHKNEDILTDALCSKEHGGRVRGMGGAFNQEGVVYSSNYTDVNGTIMLLNRHVLNNMKDVDMIHIAMNELIFGSDKLVYLAREDLLHYCGMVEIGYMCILAYITYLWDECDCARNFFVIDQSKISSHIKDRDLRSRNLANQLEAVNFEQKVLIPYNTRVEDMASKTRSTTLSINFKMETCKDVARLGSRHGSIGRQTRLGWFDSRRRGTSQIGSRRRGVGRLVHGAGQTYVRLGSMRLGRRRIDWRRHLLTTPSDDRDSESVIDDLRWGADGDATAGEMIEVTGCLRRWGDCERID